MLDGDWRLKNAPDDLAGSEVRYRLYKMPRPLWDHDHCILCWQKIAEPPMPDSVHDGYALADDDWICPDCFRTFAEYLHLRVNEDDVA